MQGLKNGLLRYYSRKPDPINLFVYIRFSYLNVQTNQTDIIKVGNYEGFTWIGDLFYLFNCS